MLYNVVLASALEGYESAVKGPCIASPGASFPLHPHPTCLGITERQADLPVFYISFPLAAHFTHGSVNISVLLSQFVPPSPPLDVSTSPCSLSASLFLPCDRLISIKYLTILFVSCLAAKSGLTVLQPHVL